MTTVTIYNDKSKNHVGFDVKGHAGFARAGNDIVCAAISMLVTNTINSIETFTDLAIEYEADEKNGHISFRIIEHTDQNSQLLIDSLILGLSQLEQNYQKNVTIKTEEV